MGFFDGSFGSVVGGLGGIVDGLLSSKAQHEANKTNLKIAEMNNEYNERMFDKQIQYNWDMFNAENEYNDPSQQVQRLLGAGINPALALENQGVSEAQGGSAPTANPAQNAHVEAEYKGNMFSRLGDMLYNDSIHQEQIRAAKLENDKKEQEIAFNTDYYKLALSRSIQEIENLKWQNTDLGNKARFDVHTFGMRSDLLRSEINKNDAGTRFTTMQSVGLMLDNQLKKFNLDHLPEEFRMQMAKAAAEVNELRSRSSANWAQGSYYRAAAENQLAQSYYNIFQAAGAQVSYKIAKETANSTIAYLNVKNMADKQESLLRGLDASGERGLIYGDIEHGEHNTFLPWARAFGRSMISPFKGIFKF